MRDPLNVFGGRGLSIAEYEPAVGPGRNGKGRADKKKRLDLMDVGRLFLADRLADGVTLRFWRDEVWSWGGLCYSVLAKSELQGQVLRWLDGRKLPTLPKYASDIVQCIWAETLIPYALDQPIDLAGDNPRGSIANLLAMRNGLLDLDKAAAGELDFQPLTPQWFSPTAVDYAYAEGAQCPVWLATLSGIFDSDGECIETLQQWFGYCLTQDTSLHCILLLEGPTRSGKGTVLRALRSVIGIHNVCSPRLAALGELFGLWGLMGKTVAICPDAHLGSGDKALAVLETLELISGEDAIEVHRKNLPPVTLRLRVRFALAVNELPRFGDAANALASRVLILPFRRSFLGCEDRKLETKLLAEREGIFCWALGGLAQLRTQGEFKKPAASKAIEADFARLVSPVKGFIEDCCEVGPNREVFVNYLWDEWKSWTEANGHRAGSKDRFGARLRTLVPGLDTVQTRQASGKRTRKYTGLRLLSAACFGTGGTGGTGEA